MTWRGLEIEKSVNLIFDFYEGKRGREGGIRFPYVFLMIFLGANSGTLARQFHEQNTLARDVTTLLLSRAIIFLRGGERWKIAIWRGGRRERKKKRRVEN